MIKNKLIALLLLFSIGVLFSNEMYIQYISKFDSSFYYVSFYPQYGQEMQMLEELEKVADENNLIIFFVHEKTKSARNQKYNIYANEKGREYLEKEAQVFEGEQRSLFSGDILVQYYDYYELEDVIIHDIPDGFRLVGDYDDMYLFKQALVDKYAGGFPHFDGYNSLEDVRGMIAVVWGIIAFIIILIEYYLINIEKKEIFVRFTVGEPLFGSLGECILRDGSLIIISFSMITVIASIVSVGVFELKTMMVFNAIMVAFMMLFYLRLYWYDISEVMSNKKISKGIIVGNYFVKAVVFILVICMLSVNIVTITKWIKYGKQEELFGHYKDSYYISFYHRDDLCEDCELVNEAEENFTALDMSLEYAFFIRQEKLGKATLVESLTSDLNMSSEKESLKLVYLSSGAEEYIKSKMLNINEFKDNTLYMLVPQNVKCSEEEKESLFGWFDSDVGKKFEEYEKIFLQYDEEVMITTLDPQSDIGSDTQINPVIAFETVKEKEIPLIEEWDYWVQGFYAHAFIEATEDDIENFLCENNICNGVRYRMNNVWENYESILTSLRRMAVISIAIIGMMISMLTFVNQTLLKMLYNGFGLELAIKKISGYSLFGRFRAMFLSDMIVGIVSIVVAYIICNTFALCNPEYIVIAGVVVIVSEILFVIYNCHKMDKERIQKILKGGCL